MKFVIIQMLLLCSMTINAATNIVTWNPSVSIYDKTFKDSHVFEVHKNDVLSCKCSGKFHDSSVIRIYLTVKGERLKVYSHQKRGYSFSNIVTFQFEEDGQCLIEYEYEYKGTKTNNLLIVATLNDFVLSKGLSIDPRSVILDVGDNYSLLPIFTPNYASNKTLEWSSSEETVASVNAEGIVNSLKAGTTIITAQTTDGSNLMASCKVAVRDLSESHDYVDLGLPSGLLWATTNIGASYPEGQGYSYSWGELFPSKRVFTTESHDYVLNKYNSDDKLTVLEPEDDVACQMWGSDWKVPAAEDFQELIDNCIVSFYSYTDEVSQNKYHIVKFTADNGNFLLLPQSSVLSSSSIDIMYWSSSLSDGNSAYSYYNQTTTNCNRVTWFERWRSMAIRPVSEMIMVKKISIISGLELKVGENKQLLVSIEPNNAINKEVTWSSSDESVAKVDEWGNIEAIKSGQAEIKVSATDGSNLFATCIVRVYNPVTDISLDKTEISMQVGESVVITPTCSPEDADDKSITWTSSSNNIVDVKDGVVFAKSVGMADVTATTVNGKAAICKVDVVRTPATSLSLNKTSLALISGDSESLTATILPTNTTNKVVVWHSSEAKVASVSSTGLVTALSTGTTLISATTTDGTEMSEQCLVSVTTPVSVVSLNKMSETLKVGESVFLQASCIPSNADDVTILWSTSNRSVADVENGKVTAYGIGETNITASSINGKKAVCTILVVETPVSFVTLDRTQLIMDVGDSFVLTPTILPETATNKNLVWYCSNEKVASVENGKVIALAPGTATIKATSVDGTNLSASCMVSVNDIKSTSISLDKNAFDMLIDDVAQLNATVMPFDATNKNIRWSSSDTNVATVDDGKVLAVGAGEAIVTVSTTDATNLSASCVINVNKHEQTISWEQELSTMSHGGEMIELISVSSSGLPVAYQSSDDNVACIFKVGDRFYLNSVDCGKATITAFQGGNSYYLPAMEVSRNIEIFKVADEKHSSILILYSSIDDIIESIVVEISKALPISNTKVLKRKISSGKEQIELTGYDNILLVYSVCDGAIISPMRKFISDNEFALHSQNVGIIEYGGISTTNVLYAKRLTIDEYNIDDVENLLGGFFDGLQTTGIKRTGNAGSKSGMYDLFGRKVDETKNGGIYIINGKKVILQ